LSARDFVEVPPVTSADNVWCELGEVVCFVTRPAPRTAARWRTPSSSRTLRACRSWAMLKPSAAAPGDNRSTGPIPMMGRMPRSVAAIKSQAAFCKYP